MVSIGPTFNLVIWIGKAAIDRSENPNDTRPMSCACVGGKDGMGSGFGILTDWDACVLRIYTVKRGTD